MTRRPAARPVSPTVVFAGCYLLAGIAAVQVVAAVASYYAVPDAMRHYSDRAGDEAAGQLAAVGLVLLTTLSLLTALVYLILAPLAAGGANPARVISWIMAGLTIVVCTVALVVGPYDAIGWYRQLTLATTITTLTFAVTATVLLALPGARPYYRRLRQAMPRPMPDYRPYPGAYPMPYGHRAPGTQLPPQPLPPPLPAPGPPVWRPQGVPPGPLAAPPAPPAQTTPPPEPPL